MLPAFILNKSLNSKGQHALVNSRQIYAYNNKAIVSICKPSQKLRVTFEERSRAA